MGKKLDELAERFFLLEAIVTQITVIFSQTATPDQLDQLKSLQDYVDMKHREIEGRK